MQNENVACRDLGKVSFPKPSVGVVFERYNSSRRRCNLCTNKGNDDDVVTGACDYNCQVHSRSVE